MTADSQQKIEILKLSDTNKKIKKPKYVKAVADDVLLCHRVMAEMLRAERHYAPVSSNYMQRVQTDITAGMRKTVTDWMLEVTEDQACAGQVFLLAVHYLDRVLSVLRIQRSQLQLVAASVLFLASKLCEVQPLTVEKLVIYTDCSVSTQELLSMEMKVLDQLSWELHELTSLDFLHVLTRQYSAPESVLRNAASFLSLAATEYQFYSVRPSLMAGAAFLAALQREGSSKVSCRIENLHSSLSSLIAAEQVKEAFHFISILLFLKFNRLLKYRPILYIY